MSSRLQIDLAEAIDDNDTDELRRLLNICDMLHKGVGSISGYEEKDMPTDEKYEEAKAAYRDLETLETITHSKVIDIEDYNPKGTSIKADNSKATKNALIYMDGIEITEHIPELNNVILMPKFDGCSVGVEIIKSGKEFIITRAHTRGTDNLNGKRQCQDKTEYLKDVSQNMINNMNKVIKSIKKPEIKITYKDMELIGK